MARCCPRLSNYWCCCCLPLKPAVKLCTWMMIVNIGNKKINKKKELILKNIFDNKYINRNIKKIIKA